MTAVLETIGGQRAQLALTLAIARRPGLLILDEPTSGLDPLMRSEFESLVRESVAEGRTVVMVTHDQIQRGYSARNLIQAITPLVGGSGGGKVDTAQGGGSDASKLDEALAAVPDAVRAQATG